MDQFKHRQSTLVSTLVERMKADIASGAYPPGSSLPSTRALAAELGVSRTSMTFVYEQLVAEGYIATRPGARATVAYDFGGLKSTHQRLDEARQTQPRLSKAALRLLAATPTTSWVAPPKFDFRYGALAEEDFPKQAWRRLIVSSLLRRQDRLAYGPSAGNPELRNALWTYLRRARGIDCHVEQIHIVQGSQQALDLCARLLLDPGDVVAMEDPGYPMAALAFEAAGPRIVNLPVDEHGAITERSSALQEAKVVFLTPSHQFPLGGILPIGRRLELLEWADKNNAYIIEDDYDSEYRYDSRPVDALFALGGGDRVLYVGTFSKTLSPQLRLGYIVAPPDLAPGLVRLKNVADRAGSRLEQLALAQFLASGGYEQHVRRMRRRNAKRREALIQALRQELGDRAEIQETAGGLHVVMWVPGVPCSHERQLADAAREAEVGLYPIGPLYRATRPPHCQCAGFVLGYASMSVQQIKDGVAALAAALRPQLSSKLSHPSHSFRRANAK